MFDMLPSEAQPQGRARDTRTKAGGRRRRGVKVRRELCLHIWAMRATYRGNLSCVVFLSLHVSVSVGRKDLILLMVFDTYKF